MPDGARLPTDGTEKNATSARTDNTDHARHGTHGEHGPAFIIGYAGHLYPWKGVDLVIEAVAAHAGQRVG